jgi:hypothetical protein
MVELGQTGRGIAFGHLGPKDLRLELVATKALLINGKCLYGKLHSVETGRFPDKIDSEALRNVMWYTLGPTQLETYLVRDIWDESSAQAER